MRQNGAASEDRIIFCRMRVVLLLCVAFAMILPLTVYAGSCPKGGDHEFKVKLVRQASNTEDGLRTYTCVKCGYSYDEVIENFGHHWSGWAVVEEPECNMTGVEERECAGCGKREQRQVNSLGHKWGPWQREGDREFRICQRDHSHKQERIAAATDDPTTATEKETSRTEAPATEDNKESKASNTIETYTGNEESEESPVWTKANTAVAAGGGLILIGLGALMFTTCLSPWMWVIVNRRRRRDEMRRRMYS